MYNKRKDPYEKRIQYISQIKQAFSGVNIGNKIICQEDIAPAIDELCKTIEYERELQKNKHPEGLKHVKVSFIERKDQSERENYVGMVNIIYEAINNAISNIKSKYEKEGQIGKKIKTISRNYLAKRSQLVYEKQNF